MSDKEEQKLEFKITAGDLNNLFKEKVFEYVLNSAKSHKEDIERSIDKIFNTGSIFNKRESEFESALDWSIEHLFREGLTKAMEELGFKEMIAGKAKEILSNNDFISELAEAKVRSSLGLPKKEK